jgi:hypothetical protein
LSLNEICLVTITSFTEIPGHMYYVTISPQKSTANITLIFSYNGAPTLVDDGSVIVGNATTYGAEFYTVPAPIPSKYAVVPRILSAFCSDSQCPHLCLLRSYHRSLTCCFKTLVSTWPSFRCNRQEVVPPALREGSKRLGR